MTHEQTIRTAVTCTGVGLHSGAPVTLRILPAAAGTGIVFQRTDLDGFEIEASGQNVARVSYATTLMRQGVMVATVEHLLAALAGSHIDNCIVELDSLEVPILDGSAEPFIEMIEHAGTAELQAPRQFLRVLKQVEVADGNRRMSIGPADDFSISCLIDFPHPLIGVQRGAVDAFGGGVAVQLLRPLVDRLAAASARETHAPAGPEYAVAA